MQLEVTRGWMYQTNRINKMLILWDITTLYLRATVASCKESYIYHVGSHLEQGPCELIEKCCRHCGKIDYFF